jgi:amidase
MIDILTMNTLEMQQAMEDEKLTSYDLVMFYLRRISEIDQGNPAYNSIFEVNPDALNIAKQLDFERKNGRVRSDIHGIPVLLKDNINTKGKMRTTAGANILKDHYAKEDAYIVRTLKERGAVILGKTNLTELACFKSFKTVNGYSSLSGYVLNPWDITKDPSGSSTGSAVSVALRLAPFAIGTETGGSIMSPSRTNGIVGLKPTIGLVSRRGIVPISSTLDTAGPMARNVTDVAVLLSAIRKNDKLDPVTNTKEDFNINYKKYLRAKSLKGKRIGIDLAHFDKLPETHQEAFNKTVNLMRELGAEIIDDLGIQQTKYIYHVMKYEFKQCINHYLAKEGLSIRLDDIVEYNNLDRENNLKYGQAVLHDALYNTSGRLNEKEYMEALEERDNATQQLEKLFKKKKIDMIYFSNYTSLGPHCGFPTLTLPIGLDENNMPIGTYFLAPMFKEKTLIEVAYNLEKNLQLNLNPLKKEA